MTRNIPPPSSVITQQILDLLTAQENLSEKDLQFAITQILDGHGDEHQSNALTVDTDRRQQEIFDRQPPELQDFMLQTALLPQSEKLPRFCNALLGIDNSEVHLQAMADHNLLGDPTFTEFLRHKVKQDQAAYQKLCLKTAKTLDSQIRSQKAIDLYVQAEAWQKAAELLENYGQELYDKGQALDLYGWLDQLTEKKLEQWPRLLLLKARILNDDLGKPKQALAIFNQAEQAFKEQGYLMGIIEAQVWQSVSFRLMGEGAKSLELVLKASAQLELLVQAPPFIRAWTLRYVGLAYGTVGQISKALLDLQRSLALFEEIGNTYYIAMCHHGIGVALAQQGQVSKAEHHFMEAARIWQKLNNQNDLANTLNSLGMLLCTLGRYEKALKQASDGFQIATKIGAVRRQAFLLQTRADVYLGRREYEQAIEFYSQSTQFAEKAGVQSLKAANMVKTGECYFYLDELDKALELSWQAGNLASENGLATEYGLSIALRARIYMYQGQSSCTGLFEMAVEHLAEGDALEQARVRLWLADNLMRNSRLLAAFEQLQAVVTFARAMGDLADRLLQAVGETRSLCNCFLHYPDAPRQMINGLLQLKNSQARKKNELKRESGWWYMSALGRPYQSVEGRRYDFSSSGHIGRTPEFLLYFILEGGARHGFLSDQIRAVLWPGAAPETARKHFHQIIKKLRNVNFKETPGYLERDGLYYRLKNYRCDVLAFEDLFARAGVLPPEEALALQHEIIALYRGEFLEGFELSEWGEMYRARLQKEFLETVMRAAEYLLEIDKPEKALAVVGKGLVHYPHNEDLGQLETKTQTQLNSQSITKG